MIYQATEDFAHVLDLDIEAVSDGRPDEDVASILAEYNENVRAATGVDPHWQDIVAHDVSDEGEILVLA